MSQIFNKNNIVDSTENGQVHYFNDTKTHWAYRQTYNIRPNKSQNLNGSRLILQLSLLNPLKPGVKSTIKM